MNVSEELWRLYHSTLTADANIMAIAHQVYDRVAANPYGSKTAYISRGPTDTVDDGADCINGLEITTQIDVWSKKDSPLECGNLLDLIRKALHEREFELDANALVEVRVVLTRMFGVGDGITTHGLVQVTARVEEPD